MHHCPRCIHTPWWLGCALLLWNACATAAPPPTPAAPWRTWYVQPGIGEHSAYTSSVGMTWSWKHPGWSLGRGQLQGHWDAFAAGWSGQAEEASRRWTGVLGIGPSVRWRADHGHAQWFVELGTAASYSSRHWHHETRRLSTRWNFASHAGVGWNWGTQRQHEISVRLQHSSNAGIKHPNPGADFVLLRYARRF